MNNNNNQKALRRTLAFIAAISFTCFSGAAELSGLVSGAEEPAASSDSKSTGTTPAVTTVTSVSEAPHTNVPDNKTSAEPVVSSSDVTSVSTTPATSHTSPVTTTEDAGKICSINITFEGNISDADAQKAIRTIFSDDRLDPEIKNKFSSMNYSLPEGCNSASDLAGRFSCITTISEKNYLHVSRGEGTNEHLFKIQTSSPDDNTLNIKLSLCYLFNITKHPADDRFSHDGNLLSNSNISVNGIIQYGGYYYVEKGALLTVTGKNAWFIKGQDTNTTKINVPHPGPEGDIYLDFEYQNHTAVFKQHYNNSENEIGNVPFEKVKLSVSLDSGSEAPLKLQINGNKYDFSSGSPAKPDWTDLYNFNFIGDTNIEYDVIVSGPEKGSTYVIKNEKLNSFTIDFNNLKLLKYKFQKYITVTVKVRPAMLSLDMCYSENKNETEKIDVSVSGGKISIPAFIEKPDDTNNTTTTYYLGNIVYKDHTENTGISSNLSGSAKEIHEFYSIDYYDENNNVITPSIEKLIYIPVANSEYDGSNINLKGEYRNNNCRCASYIPASFTYKFFELPEPAQSGSAGTTESSLNNSDSKYYVLYKINDSNVIVRQNIGDSFSIQFLDISTSKIIKILSVYQEYNGKIKEIPLSSADKLFYCDAAAPEINGISLKKGEKTLNNGDWSNGKTELIFKASDKDDGITGKEADTVNALSEDYSHIASVTIGRYNDSSKTFESAYIFTRKGTTWKSAPSVTQSSSALPYSVSFVSAENKDDGCEFRFNIDPEKTYVDEKLTVIVTDLKGNSSVYKEEKTIDLKIDTQPPKITSADLKQIIDSKQADLTDSGSALVLSHLAQELSISVGAQDEDIQWKNEYNVLLHAALSAEKNQSSTKTDTEDDSSTSADKADTENSIAVSIPEYSSKGSGIKEISAEYIFGNKSSHFKLNSSANNSGDKSRNSRLVLDPKGEVSNSSGTIKITVTDNAENKTEVYYNRGSKNNGLETSGSKDTIIFDTTPPEAKFTEPEASCFNEGTNEKWFSDFPKGLMITAYDKPAVSGSYTYNNSGLSTLNVNINGNRNEISISEKKIGISGLNNGSYSLVLNPVSADSEGNDLEVLLTDSSENSISLFKTKSSDDNKYDIQFSVTDYAGNTSKTVSYSFIIDNTPPEPDSSYTVKDNFNSNDRLFGTYFNDKVTIEIKVHDNGVSSGIKKAKLRYNGNEPEIDKSKIEKQNDGSYMLKFENIPSEFIRSDVITGNLEVSVWDNVGNTNNYILDKKTGSTHLVNSKGSSTLSFEAIPPVIEQVIPDADYWDEGKDQKWYKDDVEITYHISDAHSGIAIFEGYTENSEHKKTSEESKDFRESSSITLKSDLTLSTKRTDQNNGDGKNDGKFDFYIMTKDNAGNSTPEQEKENNKKEYIKTTVYKDVTDPEITGFLFNDNETDEPYREPGPQIPFYHFSNSDSVRVVRVFAEDLNASSGIKDIALKLNYPDGNEEIIKQPDPVRFTQEEGYHKDFVIPRNFKGTVSARATDNVGNTPEGWKTPKGYVHETADKHQTESNPYEIVLPETEYRDIKGNRLYNHDIDAAVTIKDTVSGIKDVSIEYPDGVKTAHTNLENSDLPEGWTKESNDINLLTKISTVVTQTSNKNYNEISLTATDNSGNQINTPEPVVFSIDKTKPQISVTFDNNSPDGTFTSYYKAARTATIRIKERNFSAGKVSTSYPVSGEWTLVSGAETEGTDNAVYQNTVSFTGDGTYRLTVNCSDICDNPAEASYDSGEFTVDLTVPEIKVTYDNNDSLSLNYYKGKRTAAIEVNDLNFDSSRVNITGTRNGSSELFPVINGQISGKNLVWEKASGNTWRSVVPMTEDGLYSFSVSASDKAGNTAVPYHAEFSIDTKSPEISFSGVEDKHAYNAEIKPVITINDTNIDPETITINMNGTRNKDSVKLDGTLENTDGKYIFTASDIPHSAEYDDIYTITASASDLAGNTSSSEIKISVNRFGSTFEADEKSALLSGTTVRDTEDIVIREINPDKHPDSFSPTVRVTRNGSNTVLKESEDYTKELSTQSGTGWFEYTYTIRSEVFSEDGVYEISIYSEDNATNKNYSDSILKFSVDKTKPSVNYLTIEPGGIYKTDSKQVTAILNDNMEIDPDSIKVYVNSDQLSRSDFTYDERSNEISFTVRNLNSTQYVEIMAADMAGNQLDPVEAKIENLFISTSSARILLHKTWFKIAASAAGLAAVASGAFVVLRKKKKQKNNTSGSNH